MADAAVTPAASPRAHPSSDLPASSALSPFKRHRAAFLATAAVVSFGAAVTAFAVADDTPLPSARRIVEELQAPDMQPQLEALAARDDVFVTEQRIRSGDTLGTLLNRLGVSDTDAESFLRASPDARALRALRPGRLVQVHVDEDGTLQWLRYAHSATEGKEAGALANGHALVVERSIDHGNARFAAHDETLANERRVELRSGEIHFYRDVRRGDRFRVVYESYYQGGEFVRAGRILAIEFTNGGKSHSAMWYGGPNTAEATLAGHYYGFDGRSLRRAFLRSPLEFTRISSGFGGRMHPISNQWRQHTGVDYAAPQGTPVRTTADGVVDFAGVKNGYGNVVIIHHQGVYSTLYGHLSQFAAGLKRGQRIEQGSLIGYVGMTGWATGPHLHYEFRIADHATNPLTAALPEAPPIGRADWPTFHKVADGFDRQIDLLRSSEGLVAAAASAPGSASVATSRRVSALPNGG
jgi:murein DD-endopeptidase MepM/ murein hydrolase activator NlpD